MLGDWLSINDIVRKLLHFFLLVFLICGVVISLIMFLGKYGGMNLLLEVFQGNAAFICLASSLNYFFFKQEKVILVFIIRKVKPGFTYFWKLIYQVFLFLFHFQGSKKCPSFVLLPLQFFIYEFTGKQERVVVKVESSSKTCAELKIQTEVRNKHLPLFLL